MPIAAAGIMAGGSLLGGLLGGSSARRAAEAQSRAQIEAARIAADEARFRPIGVTTRFGQSQFGTGADGRVNSAGYTLTPEIQALQDRFMALTGQGLTQAEGAQQAFAPLSAGAQGLFGLGQQYLGPSAGAQALTSLGQQYVAQSPQEAAQQYMSRQQDLLAPSRERQLAGIQNSLFNTGRGGLAVGATGTRPGGGAGLGAANPEMEAYYNALAQQDAQLAAGAQQAGMDQTRFGAGLLGSGQALGQDQIRFGAGLLGTGGELLRGAYQGQVSALSPYQAYLGGATGLENLGQQTLDMGSALGGRNVNQTGASALYGGGMAAAKSMYDSNSYNPFATALIQGSQNPALARGLGNLFGNQPFSGTAIYGPTSMSQLDYASLSGY